MSDDSPVIDDRLVPSLPFSISYFPFLLISSSSYNSSAFWHRISTPFVVDILTHSWTFLRLFRISHPESYFLALHLGFILYVVFWCIK